MAIDDLHSYLNSFINYERNLPTDPQLFKLDRMRRLLESIGNPQQSLRCIHVAGTKGKGSACALTAEIFRQAGYRVGLYTSPHLMDVRERIRILSPAQASFDGIDFMDMVPEEDFREVIESLKPHFEKWRATELGKLSYFEILTAAAFWYFVRKSVDLAVIETGLGGRLDATNCVNGSVSAITSIGLEHTAQLGNTLAEIAREKAAILKPGMKAVIAPQDPAVMDVIREHCQRHQISFAVVGKDISFERSAVFSMSQKIRIVTKQNSIECDLRLAGEHQAINAAVAVGLAEAAGSSYGLHWDPSHAVKAAADIAWPGRFEVIDGQTPVILDVAHTPSAARYLGQTLAEVFPQQPVIAVVGMLEDKNQSEFIRELAPHVVKLIMTKPDHPRGKISVSEESIPVFLKGRFMSAPKISEAVTMARQTAKQGAVIVITGSVYTVAEARQQLLVREKV